jgi:ribonuclease HI
MNKKLKIVESWCASTGLHVNPGKTTMMRFTRRTKERIIEMKNVELFGEKLELAHEFKYLGVILDPKLSMKRHIEEAAAKGLRSLWAAKAMVSRTWGLSPSMAIMYGSIVWWHRTRIKSYANKLNAVQRLAMLMCTGAMKSTPTLALNIALDLSPIQIRAEKNAAECYLRLQLCRTWDCLADQTEHGEIIYSQFIQRCNENTDKCPKEWNFCKKFKTHIGERDSWNQLFENNEDSITWFSDGSKKEEKVGAGIYCPKLRTVERIRISDHSTVMQAELTGITMCAETTRRQKITGKQIVILSDSQAAIKSLESNVVQSKTVKKCINEVNKLGETNDVTIGWIPGHAGWLGNEIADKLANEDASKFVIVLLSHDQK